MAKQNQFWRDNSVLVTGATGFIGSQLVKRLLQEKARVSILCRKSPDVARCHFDLSEVTVHIATGTEEIANVISTVKPIVVFHLASHAISNHTPADIVPLVDSNVLLPTQICDGMSRTDCRAIVAMGSAWQHFEGS